MRQSRSNQDSVHEGGRRSRQRRAREPAPSGRSCHQAAKELARAATLRSGTSAPRLSRRHQRQADPGTRKVDARSTDRTQPAAARTTWSRARRPADTPPDRQRVHELHARLPPASSSAAAAGRRLRSVTSARTSSPEGSTVTVTSPPGTAGPLRRPSLASSSAASRPGATGRAPARRSPPVIRVLTRSDLLARAGGPGRAARQRAVAAAGAGTAATQLPRACPPGRRRAAPRRRS